MRRLFIVAFALLSIQGCRDTDTGVQITGTSQPTAECEYEQDTPLGGGSWDLTGRGAYTMGAIVMSELVSHAIDIQADTSTVTISEFEVELLRPDGEPLDTGSLPNPYKVSTSLVLAGGTSNVAIATVVPPSYAPFVLDLVDPDTGGGQLLIELQAAGSTVGGLSIKTVDYPWAVTVCAGTAQGVCLYDCSDDAAAGCTPGQDGVSWCPDVEPADAGELGDDAGAM